MNYGLLPKLTKSYILDRLTQEQIFEHYLSVKVDYDDPIISPFRPERNPSAGFYRDRKGRVRLNDMGGEFHGDCFDAAGYITSIPVNTRGGFTLLLHTIAKDFRIHKYADEDEVRNFYKLTEKFNKAVATKRREVIIKVKARSFNSEDWKFWGNISTEPLLNYFNVYPIEEAYMQKGDYAPFKLYSYNYKDPCYGYYFGKDKKGKEQWRLYFPKRLDKKFITNCYLLQGEKQMEVSKFGIITKSYKDVIALRSFGINSVAPSSEKTILSKHQIEVVKRNYTFIGVFMDFDAQGVRNMIQHKKLYNLTPILFTDSLFNYKGFKGCKDFTDFVNKFGRPATQELISNYYKPYKEAINNYYQQETNYFKTLQL